MGGKYSLFPDSTVEQESDIQKMEEPKWSLFCSKGKQNQTKHKELFFLQKLLYD